MIIIKRDLSKQEYSYDKIFNAILKAVRATNNEISNKDIDLIVKEIESQIFGCDEISVEEIQDLVEKVLMTSGYVDIAKSYILYRAKRTEYRQTLNNFKQTIENDSILSLLKTLQGHYQDKLYSLDFLYAKYQAFYKTSIEPLDILIKAAVELITPEAPDWEFIASRLYLMKLENLIKIEEQRRNIKSFYDKISYLVGEKLYGKYILDNYTKEEVEELERTLEPERNNLLTYSSLQLVSKRYLISDKEHKVLERPQEMFMGIAMHLAIPEGEKKVFWAKKIYDILSKLKVTMATPTMSNARKPHSQLSSCFEDIMPDSLRGIYRTIDNFAEVSKFGGGMGIYMGKVRAVGSDIRGFKGV